MKIHENFTWYKQKNDIALIHVSKPIEYGDKIGKVSLQTETFNNNYTSAILTGWGETEVRFFYSKLYIKKISTCLIYQNDDYPIILQEITLNIYKDQEKCNEIYLKEIREKHNDWLTSEIVTDGHICTLNKFAEGSCSVRYIFKSQSRLDFFFDFKRFDLIHFLGRFRWATGC